MAGRNIIPAPLAGSDDLAALVKLIRDPSVIEQRIAELQQQQTNLTALIETHTEVAEAATYVAEATALITQAKGERVLAETVKREADAYAERTKRDADDQIKLRLENADARERAVRDAAQKTVASINEQQKALVAREQLLSTREHELIARAGELKEKMNEVDTRLAKLKAVMT